MSSAATDTSAERVTRVARVRSEIDAGIWVVIWLSLAFTAINVQIFAARGAEVWSLAWCAAWLLDPMVSILVLVVVRAEQITSRWQVALGWPITATKWGCFAATYAMNTWASWVERSPSMIVLHSVPPAMMLLAAEVGPRIRDGLTRAVLAASAQYAAAEQAEGVLPTGGGLVAHSPLPSDGAPDGARGPNPIIPPVGSGPGRVSGPVDAVEVEPPTTDTATGSGPDRKAGTPDRLLSNGHEPRDVIRCSHGPAGARSSVCRRAGAADHDPVLPVEAEVRAAETLAAEGGTAGPLDPRVRLLRELLDSNCAVTGAQAATLLTHAHGSTSDRTGRRLLAEARQAHPADTGPAGAGPDPRGRPGSERDNTATTDRDERTRTGTDGASAASPLSLVPRSPQPLPGDPS